MSEDKRWPAGEPNEAEIRARIAHSLEEIPCHPTISRGDLANLDEVIGIFDALANAGLVGDQYGNMWNLRNHLVPFEPGDEHYDYSDDD